MDKQLSQYLDAIRNDYRVWQSKCNIDTGYEGDKVIRERMLQDFCDSVRFEDGRKYIKVIRGSSVHSFIMKADDKQFKQGDILKAASWATPARNFARGNILKGSYKISWTGAV